MMLNHLRKGGYEKKYEFLPPSSCCIINIQVFLMQSVLGSFAHLVLVWVSTLSYSCIVNIYW